MHLKIFVVMSNSSSGKTLTLDVDSNHTVPDIRYLIEFLENLPQNEQRLFLNGKELQQGCIKDLYYGGVV